MRRQRPSAERFLNSENFELKFQAVTTEYRYGKKYGEIKACGAWMGREYHETIDLQPFPVKVVIDGIMEQ